MRIPIIILILTLYYTIFSLHEKMAFELRCEGWRGGGWWVVGVEWEEDSRQKEPLRSENWADASDEQEVTSQLDGTLKPEIDQKLFPTVFYRMHKVVYVLCYVSCIFLEWYEKWHIPKVTTNSKDRTLFLLQSRHEGIWDTSFSKVQSLLGLLHRIPLTFHVKTHDSL